MTLKASLTWSAAHTQRSSSDRALRKLIPRWHRSTGIFTVQINASFVWEGIASVVFRYNFLMDLWPTSREWVHRPYCFTQPSTPQTPLTLRPACQRVLFLPYLSQNQRTCDNNSHFRKTVRDHWTSVALNYGFHNLLTFRNKRRFRTELKGAPKSKTSHSPECKTDYFYALFFISPCVGEFQLLHCISAPPADTDWNSNRAS